MHPRYLETQLYTYILPEERIAQFPLPERDQSKLLVYENGEIREDVYEQISMHIPSGSLLVFNNTRVIHARILFQKPSGGTIEVFVLDPADPDGYSLMSEQETGKATWNCLIGGAGKWKNGQVVQKHMIINGSTVTLTASIAGRQPGCFVIEFSWQPSIPSFLTVLANAGSVPVPPYLKRKPGTLDDERYQTIYANREGSVAAPTAGLHFTQRIFDMLAAKSIRSAYTTLHVGAGTFMPVKSSTLEGHTMHAEWMEIERSFLQQLLYSAQPVVAVGTTSLRTLESLYWMGCKTVQHPGISADELAVQQWDAYEVPKADTTSALKALDTWMDARGLQQLAVKTQLLIAPPYRAKVAAGLITNFHQPGSTLLLLVAAVTNGRWKEIYDYALDHDFRFLSYGDGCLIWFD